MISTVLLVLLVGGCAGLQMRAERVGKNLQKDMPMTTMMPMNSTDNMMNMTMVTMMPMNSTDNMMNMTMTTMMSMNSTDNTMNMTMVTMVPMNATTTTEMPVWNMTTMDPGSNFTMVTTSEPNTTFPWTTMTPTPTPTSAPGNGSCGGILFVEQMTRDISQMNKMNFFNITKSLVSQLHSENKMAPYSFGYAQFGNGVYKGINTSDYFDFMRDLEQAESNFTMYNKPNGGYTYLEP